MNLFVVVVLRCYVDYRPVMPPPVRGSIGSHRPCRVSFMRREWCYSSGPACFSFAGFDLFVCFDCCHFEDLLPHAGIRFFPGYPLGLFRPADQMCRTYVHTWWHSASEK